MGNHDYGRVAHYFDPEYNSILLALVTMLPGTSTTYYGEELNMAANHLVQSDDPVHRTFHRSPMHWDDTRNAGKLTSVILKNIIKSQLHTKFVYRFLDR